MTQTIPLPSDRELEELYARKYGSKSDLGWGPRLRMARGYYTPDEYYEALVARLVPEGARWVDIGCGRDIFPSNADLARDLSERAGYVLGIDPDQNIHDNPYLSEAFQGLVDAYEGPGEFDLATLRMVAEHIEFPVQALEQIGRLLKPGGVVVVYTPFKWAPVSIAARWTPMAFHHAVKRVLWQTEERDTFPVQYRLNIRRDQLRHFAAVGFDCELYAHLDDCRVFSRFRLTSELELALWRALRTVGLHYPETCLLSAFRKRT